MCKYNVQSTFSKTALTLTLKEFPNFISVATCNLYSTFQEPKDYTKIAICKHTFSKHCEIYRSLYSQIWPTALSPFCKTKVFSYLL